MTFDIFNGELLAKIFLLLILLDPLGNISLFHVLLKQLSPQRRRFVILRENLIAFVALVFFTFFGDSFLKLFNLSESALEISGGIVLFLIALRMVFPAPESAWETLPENQREPFIVPLAIPLIVGPASLATAILTSRSSETFLPFLAAIFIAMSINVILLLLGNHVARLLGRPGLLAMERLMGLVLTALAVQMLISGFRNAFHIAP